MVGSVFEISSSLLAAGFSWKLVESRPSRCALAAGRVLKGFLAVSPHDPLTYVGVTGVLVLVAMAACYIPARRTMGVDPMIALRHE